MDPRERFAQTEEALRIAMQGRLASLWTALPGEFVSFNTDDPGHMTAVVQPTLTGVTQSTDGSYQSVQLPLLLDVPVVFPSGGGCTLTFPLKQGDECLVIFSSRCIDTWWQAGGVQLPFEPRMHDLSDGFAIPGPRSVPRVIPEVSTTEVQLRSDDGTARFAVNPDSHLTTVATVGDLVVHAGGDLTATVGGDVSADVTGSVTASASSFDITGDTTINGNVTINGSLSVTGAITSDVSVTAPTVTGSTDVVFGSHSATAHIHSGGTIAGHTGATI